MLVSPDSMSSSSATFQLSHLQDLILACGPGHFNTSRHDPLHYFKILMLAGMYETAILYLLDNGEHYMESVHVAIVLAYHGLLRSSGSHESSTPEDGKTSCVTIPHVVCLTPDTLLPGS